MTTVPTSPAIVANISQLVDYNQDLGDTIPCIVGGATKGPLNLMTLITSVPELVRQFGEPVSTDYGLLAAVTFLENGGSALYYLRVANSAVSASVNVSGNVGGVTAVAATGTIRLNSNLRDADNFVISDGTSAITFEVDKATAASAVTTFTAQPTDGDSLQIIDNASSPVTRVFEFDNNSTVGGSNVAVTLGASLGATLQALADAINAESGYAVTAVADIVNMTVTYTQDDVGTAGNTTVTEVDFGGVMTTVGGVSATAGAFDGGANAGVTGANVSVTGGASAALTASTLVDVINAHAFGVTAVLSNTGSGALPPLITLTNDTAGTAGNVAITNNASTRATVTGMSGGVAAVGGTPASVLQVAAYAPGTWGNYVKATIVTPSVVIGATAGNFDLTVTAPVDSDTSTLQTVEVFTNLSMDSASARFVETVINSGIRNEVNPSSYIIVTALRNDTNPVAGAATLGTTVSGADGITGLAAANYVGTLSGVTATGLQAAKDVDTVEFTHLLVPGQTHIDVITEMLSVADTRKDCAVILDPPFGLAPQEVTDWHNGTSALVSNAPAAALDNWRGRLYWSWVQDYSAYIKQDMWLPPSGYVVAAMARTAAAIGPWIPTAGHVRGVLAAKKVEHSPRQTSRDILLGNGSKVNPIVAFPAGLTVMGNATLQRAKGPLDAAHVADMVLYCTRNVKEAVKHLQFAPNEAATWSEFRSAATSVLQFVQSQRGLESFQVKCDEFTNSAALRAQKVMNGRISLKHIDAAESIVIDFALTETNTEATLA